MTLKESISLPGGNSQSNEYIVKSNATKKNDDSAVLHAKNISSDQQPSVFDVLIREIKSILLPIGYPDSVATEYMQFQFWDTLQELLGYLKSLITSHANLTSIGVGNASVSIISVLLANTITNLITRLLGLYISARYARIFGCNMKVFWLFSSMISIICGFITLIAAIFTQYYMYLLIISGVIGTIGNVPGSIASAGLAHHLAKNKNYSDVAAKEGNQNRVGKLIMISFSYHFILFISNNSVIYAWFAYVFLVLCQIYCIFKSIQTLQLKSINHIRLDCILNIFCNSNIINIKSKNIDVDITPFKISQIESMSVFKVLHFFDFELLSLVLPSYLVNLDEYNIYFGKSLKHLVNNTSIAWNKHIQLFKNSNYMIVIESNKKQILVFENKNTTSQDQIVAYFHAYLIKQEIEKRKVSLTKRLNGQQGYQIVEKCSVTCQNNASKLIKALETCGWDTDDTKFGSERWCCQWK